MSEKGQFRPIDDVCAMSAFPPIATDLPRCGERRNGPRTDIGHRIDLRLGLCASLAVGEGGA